MTEIRELINNGFARAELASIADKDATRVYGGARAEGTVVANKCTNAIENYKAAIACFMRALPSLSEDDGSAELVRTEVARLLARLNEVRALLSRMKSNDDDEEENEEDDDEALRELRRRLEADLAAKSAASSTTPTTTKFKPGDVVEMEILETDADGRKRNAWIPATIVAVNADENGTSSSSYDVNETEGGTLHRGVPEVRLRFPGDHQEEEETETQKEKNERERERIVSEIVESERRYRDAMRDLMRYYLTPMNNPTQWGGQKTSEETLFTQKIVSREEMRRIFGNAEEITGISQMFCKQLEERFARWTREQKLADIFTTYAPFLKCYAIYAEAYHTSNAEIARLKRERVSFVAVLERAEAQGVRPLEELMRLPVKRVGEYKQLLMDLSSRTPPDHPDAREIKRAYLAMGEVEDAIAEALNRLENMKKLREIENYFSPPLGSLDVVGGWGGNPRRAPRRFVRWSETLKRMERAQVQSSSKRAFWLFNDALLCARPSEWLNVGSYRFLGMLSLRRVRLAPEFGPLAFEVRGKRITTTKRGGDEEEGWVLIASNESELNAWMRDLRGFVRLRLQQPPPRDDDDDDDDRWIRRADESSGGRVYFYNAHLGATSWEEPVWRRARGIYAFTGEDPAVDFSFSKGEEFFVEIGYSRDEGWARARSRGGGGKSKKIGLVPLNRVEIL